MTHTFSIAKQMTGAAALSQLSTWATSVSPSDQVLVDLSQAQQLDATLLAGLLRIYTRVAKKGGMQLRATPSVAQKLGALGLSYLIEHSTFKQAA